MIRVDILLVQIIIYILIGDSGDILLFVYDNLCIKGTQTAKPNVTQI